MAFPTSNLRLSTVLAAYGITTGKMSDLKGKYYYTTSPLSTLTQIPLNGPFSLSTLLGKTPWTGSTSSFFSYLTSTGTINSPANYPLPTAIAIILTGGGGGGGGAGGDYNATFEFRPGGQGCGGGGGAYLLTNQIAYNSGNAITVNSMPVGGFGGLGGFGGNNTSDGAAGNPGGPAIVTYGGQIFTANGGSGGNGGFRGQAGVAPGGANANQPVAGGSFSGSNLSPSSNGGANGVVRNGGTSGNGQPSGGLGGQGNSGSNGIQGQIQIIWYFV
jgi:hypothetical protein